MTYENWPMTNDISICHWSLANSRMSFGETRPFFLFFGENAKIRPYESIAYRFVGRNSRRRIGSRATIADSIVQTGAATGMVQRGPGRSF